MLNVARATPAAFPLIPASSGYNEYFGWYDAFGTAEQFGAWADNLHAQKPTWKLGVSEYGAGAALTQHRDPPTAPDPYGALHPEEWQNLVHETHWKQMTTRPYSWSKIIWNMFDFAVDSRDEGDTPGRNDKGLVSYDQKTSKDAFLVQIQLDRHARRRHGGLESKVKIGSDAIFLP